MSLNDRLSTNLNSMLSRHGFDATLQHRVGESESDFEPDDPSWSNIATVKAVWDNPRAQTRGVNDTAPASMVTRRMTLAYRSDLKETEKAVGLRVLVDGVAHGVLGIGMIGSQVGLRLIVDAGTEAV